MPSNKKNLEEYKSPVKVQSYYADLEKQKLLKEKINNASKSIRKKYLALKTGKADEDETLKRIFKPIIEPLTEIKTNTLKEIKKNKNRGNTARARAVAVKKETPISTELPLQEEASTSSSSATLVPEDDEEPTQEVFSDPFEEEEEEDVIVGEERYKKRVIDDYLDQFAPLGRQYIKGFFTSRDNYDETFGARFDITTNKLFIGNKNLNIGPKSELKIDNKQYEGTRGLYELIFLKKPKFSVVNDRDLSNYKEILKLTSAHKRNYDPEEQVRGNKYHKYEHYKTAVGRKKS